MVTKTIVVIGYTHGGTTMLAGILQILGVPMVGDDYKRDKLEDMEVFRAIQDEAQFAELVGRRNARHEVWGFKHGGLWLYADLMKKYLRNPVYIAIFKCPASVTRRRFGIVTGNRVRATIEQMKDSIDGMCESRLRPHVLSYLDAVANPNEFVNRVAEICGLEIDEERLQKAVRHIRPNRSGEPFKRYPRIDA